MYLINLVIDGKNLTARAVRIGYIFYVHTDLHDVFWTSTITRKWIVEGGLLIVTYYEILLWIALILVSFDLSYGE